MNKSLSRRLIALARNLETKAVPAHLIPHLQSLVAQLEKALPDESKSGLTDSSPGQADPVPGRDDAGIPAGEGVTGSVLVWCDGSCAPNPGPGGWGAILDWDGERLEISGAAPDSTNNMMEMTAAIEALKRTPEGAAVIVTTDSRYLMYGITRWLEGWKRKGWRRADGKPVLNQELWRALDALAGARRVTWKWVAGHSGNPENERCDELANEARRGGVAGN